MSFVRDRDQIVVNGIAALTLVTTVLIRVPGARTRPWFAGAADWASLAADLGVGYLAAWLFYYLVSWRPAYYTRQRIAVMAARQTFAAMAHVSQLRGMLRGSVNSTETGPMTRTELRSLCDALHLLSPSTDVSIMDIHVHVPVVQSIWRHVEMVCADVAPIVELGALFDADIVADAAMLKTSTLTSIRTAAEITPAIDPPGLALTYMTDWIWEFIDFAERLWLVMFERYPNAAASVAPTIASEYLSGKSRVLSR